MIQVHFRGASNCFSTRPSFTWGFSSNDFVEIKLVCYFDADTSTLESFLHLFYLTKEIKKSEVHCPSYLQYHVKSEYKQGQRPALPHESELGNIMNEVYQ